MSANPISIYKGQDFYVPYFEIKLGEQRLSREVIHDITQVSYKDSLDQIDSFEITISNWDSQKRRFKYSDEQRFDPGKKMEIWMGYFGRDSLRLMCTGQITALRPTFPAGGQPTLAISGLNVLHQLRRKQETMAYRNKTASEIARQVAGRLGVQLTTDSQAAAQEERYNYVLQHSQYDILFLLERARRVGYDLWAEEDSQGSDSRPSKLYFGPSQGIRQTEYKLEYGKSLIDFQPTLTTANQVGKVTVLGWDALRKQPIRETATLADLRPKGVGQSGGQDQIEQAYQDREEVITDVPVNSAQEAKTLARERLRRIAKDLVTGHGSTLGLPDLRTGCLVTLLGLGERFSGQYFVTGTDHSIGDGGYTTQFDCRLPED
jgi:phage protein D